MKLLFSEQKSDYDNYQFPYAIWAVPEAGETPADIFNAGFLPSSRNLDRFYLCRQVRVNLAKFKPSSENRRILRKGGGINVELVPRAKFDYTPERRQFFKTYADIKFGKDVMTFERLDALFAAPIISHLLVFTDAEKGGEIGVATLYLDCLLYTTDMKVGKLVMTFERLYALFAAPIISHLLVFTDAEKGGEIGVATLYLEGKALAFYY